MKKVLNICILILGFLVIDASFIHNNLIKTINITDKEIRFIYI